MQLSQSATALFQRITSLSEQDQLTIYHGLGERLGLLPPPIDTANSTSVRTNCTDQFRHAPCADQRRHAHVASSTHNETVIPPANSSIAVLSKKRRQNPNPKHSERHSQPNKRIQPAKQPENNTKKAERLLNAAFRNDSLRYFPDLWTNVTAPELSDFTTVHVQERLVADNIADGDHCALRTRLRALLLVLDHDIHGDSMVTGHGDVIHAKQMLRIGRKYLEYANHCGLSIILRLMNDRQFWTRLSYDVFHAAYDSFGQTVDLLSPEEKRSRQETDVKYQQMARSLLRDAAKKYGLLSSLEKEQHELSSLYRGDYPGLALQEVSLKAAVLNPPVLTDLGTTILSNRIDTRENESNQAFPDQRRSDLTADQARLSSPCTDIGGVQPCNVNSAGLQADNLIDSHPSDLAYGVWSGNAVTPANPHAQPYSAQLIAAGDVFNLESTWDEAMDAYFNTLFIPLV